MYVYIYRYIYIDMYIYIYMYIYIRMKYERWVNSMWFLVDGFGQEEEIELKRKEQLRRND